MDDRIATAHRCRATVRLYPEAAKQIAIVATKRRLTDPDHSWADYWRQQSPEERLAMATELSLECADATDSRLRRVHRVLRQT